MASKFISRALVVGLISMGSIRESQALDLTTDEDKVSYTLGRMLGEDLKRSDSTVNSVILAQGVDEALKGTPSKVDDQERQRVMVAYQKAASGRLADKIKKQGEENLKIGKEFLEQNAKKEGVKSTPSGLQYKVIKEGSGANPKATDIVKVNYRGTLIDGTEFDSSYKRNQAAEFGLNQVIKGWTEGLQLMKPGSKYQFFIPADLAYGDQARGGPIGPNQTLIFEVEFLEVVTPKTEPAIKPSAEKK